MLSGRAPARGRNTFGPLAQKIASPCDWCHSVPALTTSDRGRCIRGTSGTAKRWFADQRRQFRALSTLVVSRVGVRTHRRIYYGEGIQQGCLYCLYSGSGPFWGGLLCCSAHWFHLVRFRIGDVLGVCRRPQTGVGEAMHRELDMPTYKGPTNKHVWMEHDLRLSHGNPLAFRDCPRPISPRKSLVRGAWRPGP